MSEKDLLESRINMQSTRKIVSKSSDIPEVIFSENDWKKTKEKENFATFLLHPKLNMSVFRLIKIT
jgi:hypothetical protein